MTRPRLPSFIVCAALALQTALFAAQENPPPAPEETETRAAGHLELAHRLLDTALADGFDFPAGNSEGTGTYVSKSTRRKYTGWKVTGKPGTPDGDQTHTGEAWNGSGGGDTDAGQPVYAIASGTVRELRESPRGPALVIEHRFVENGTLRTVWSVSAGLADITIKAGDTVKRRQQIGVIARADSPAPVQLYLEIRTGPAAEAEPVKGCEPPSEFIRVHRKLFVPARAKSLIIASKKDYRLLFCKSGKVVEDLPIALSQNPLGPKVEDGDNRTPEGEYRIIQKAEGPFAGEYGKFLGSRWMRLNYPNPRDARTALAAGRITQKQCEAILAAHQAGRMPPPGTKLGGGVGIHGWASDWPDGSNNLTWGCLSLREADLKKLYALTESGTVVLIHP